MMCVLASADVDAVGFKFAPDTSMTEDAVDITSFVWSTGVEKTERSKSRRET